jgi:hypothetical protein
VKYFVPQVKRPSFCLIGTNLTSRTKRECKELGGVESETQPRSYFVPQIKYT